MTEAEPAPSCAPTPAPGRSVEILWPDDRISQATTILCLALITLGVLWRLTGLDFPPDFSFDEHHFVRNARNYIAHVADWNDHPPMGKLVLVPAMLIFGDRGLGWRLASAVFGVVLIGLVGVVAGSLFRDRRAGLFAATFAAIDGIFVSYARTALVDTPLMMFMFGGLALMLRGRWLGWFALAAVSLGLAIATKWTAVCVFLLAPWLLRRYGRSAWHTLWMLALAALVYFAIFALGLAITRMPISLSGMLRTNLDLLKHHAGFTEWDNGAASKWYTWPFLIHPIILRYAEIRPDRLRVTTTLGNPLLWYTTTAVCFWMLFELGKAIVQARRAHARLPEEMRATGFVLGGMVALTLPFILTKRESYIWHYFGAYALALGLVAAVLARLERRRPMVGLVVCGVIALVSLYYSPVWTDGVIDRAGFLHRLPFPGWR